MHLSEFTHSFEEFLFVVTEHHKQVDLPAGVAVHRVHLQGEEDTQDITKSVGLVLLFAAFTFI